MLRLRNRRWGKIQTATDWERQTESKKGEGEREEGGRRREEKSRIQRGESIEKLTVATKGVK